MHCLHRIYWGNRSACCHPNRPFLPLPPPALVLRCHAPRSFLSSLPVSLSFSSQEKPIIFLLVPNAYKSVTVAPTLVHSTKWLCRPVSDIYFFDCPSRCCPQCWRADGEMRLYSPFGTWRARARPRARAAKTRRRDGGIT